MSSYNKIILIGNLTQKPELRKTDGGRPYANFGIAVNSWYLNSKGNKCEETTFIDVIAWGKLAELVDQHLSKGSLVHVDGRIQFRTWEDKVGRGKRSKHSVVAESIQFLGGRVNSATYSSIPQATHIDPPRMPESTTLFHTEPAISISAKPIPAFSTTVFSSVETDDVVNTADENPMDEDLTEREIELLEEINDPDWQENVLELCRLKRAQYNPNNDRDDLNQIRRRMEDILDGLKDLRAIYANADDLREGRDDDED